MKLLLFLFLCCAQTSLGSVGDLINKYIAQTEGTVGTVGTTGIQLQGIQELPNIGDWLEDISQTVDSTPGNLQTDKRCHSNLFDEAVELLSTHTVKRLEKQILENENALKKKEFEIEMLKLELEKKQQEMEMALKGKEHEVETVKLELGKKQDEMEKSWTLVSYMMNVMSSSQEMIKAKEELVVTQAAKIEEMKKQINEYTQMTEDTVRRLNISHIVIEAQEKTIDELRKVVTEDSKLTDTYRELKEGNLLQTHCDVPPYLPLMTDALNSQQEEISELKAVLLEEDSIKILLSNITREMTTLSGSIQASEENWEVLETYQRLLEKQSKGLDILRTLASYGVTRNNSLRYEEGDDGQLCQCIPDPPVNQTVTLTLIRNDDTITSQWSSWQGCEGIHLANGTEVTNCAQGGEGTQERRRLKDINSNSWDEEVEEEPCPACPQFLVEWSAWQYKCEGIRLPNGTNVENCGEGTKERRRLKHISSNKWDEEVEEESCPLCPQFLEQCFNYNELDSPSRNFKNRGTRDCSNEMCCDKIGSLRGGSSKTPDWKGSGWYRVAGQAGSQLNLNWTGTGSGTAWRACGTGWGGWLSGEHPSSGQGEVTRTVYFDSNSRELSDPTSIKIVNCNDEFFIYYLPNVPFCNLGYCTV